MIPRGAQWWVGRRILLTYMVVVLVVMFRLVFLSSVLLSNAGWLQLAVTDGSGTPRETQVMRALNLFQKALVIDAPSRTTLLGTGMAYLMTGNEAAALSNWQEAEIAPRVPIGFGDQARVDQRWNDALLYYRSATRLEQGQSNEGQLLAAKVCQQTFAQPDVLDQPNEAYCQNYFSKNGDNLIINGQFDMGNGWGWGRRYFSSHASVTYGVDRTTGKPAPAASLVGFTEDYHGGLFQTITLPAGITVRYSAWVKVQCAGQASVRLLYFGGQRDGKPIGSALQTVSEEMEWTYLERAFQVPEADGALLRFFPVLLAGRGIVWVDDVRLELHR